MVIWLLHLQVKICLLQVWMICLLQSLVPPLLKVGICLQVWMICLLQSLVPPLLKVVCLQVWMVIWLHLIQQAN
jgi:hypothetical protein